ncbi:hypothetical protein [Paenibacillus koleovorans]|uniref:hypothetical protein n=1 Tax=Paenibacillus koleovorans TaxID=121608 RepID=UPI000FDA2A02|nr:hypothetical protein [Paenibacillus koleovorans]
MIDPGSILLFMIISFSLALILIMKRETIPPQLRRTLALIAIVMVSCSFFLLLYSMIGSM